MIITKLKGGLGNQMFQFAVGKGLQKNGEKLFLDNSYLFQNRENTERLTVRDFELNLFPHISAEVLSERKREFYFSPQRRFVLLRKILGINILKIAQEENEFVHIPETNNILFLEGFFQSEQYFIKKRAEILKNFEFPALDDKNLELAKQIESTNSVSIHIRRGDYLKESVKRYHGILPNSYYLDGLKLIQEKTGETKCFVFSDSPEIACEIFGNDDQFIFVKNNSGADSWKDMCLMSKCKHHIIANSSFSWWGAWLSQHNGINIGPKNWFNPEVANFDADVILPKNWIKL